MKNTMVRLVLVFLALVAVGGAGYYVFTLEQRSSALRDADRAFTEDLLRLQATLADLRAGHAGYLATGQDTAVWIEKVLQLQQQADAQLKRLLASQRGAEVEGTLATVGESLASFGRFDARVKDVLRNEQPLTASSLIFSDSAQLLGTANASLSTARGAVASKTGAAFARARQFELYAVAGAGVAVLVVMLLLLPVGRARREVEQAAEAVEAAEGGAGARAIPAASGRTGLGLDLAPRTRSDVQPIDADLAQGSERDVPLTRELSFAALDRPEGRKQAVSIDGGDSGDLPGMKLDLPAAARLCTDLARVHDTSELQGMLARAAVLLNATGIVVWMGGVEGDVLWPAFSHGYSPQVLAKMQALPRDAATPVSEAFRKGLMEVVPAGDRSSGAIVAPILTAGGCVGVMAVEISHGAETIDAEQALASILAAQLATLVASETSS